MFHPTNKACVKTAALLRRWSTMHSARQEKPIHSCYFVMQVSNFTHRVNLKHSMLHNINSTD